MADNNQLPNYEAFLNMQPEEQANTMKALQYQNLIKGREELAAEKAVLQELENKPRQQVDALTKGLAAAADVWTGTNLSALIKDKDSVQAMIDKLKEGIDAKQKAITDDELQFLQSIIGQTSREKELSNALKVAGVKKDKQKELSQGEIEALSEADSAEKKLISVIDRIKKNKNLMGIGAGIKAATGKAAFNLWGEEEQKLRGEIDFVRQKVGTALEGGVLKDRDDIKYKKILATIFDNPEVAAAKLENVLKGIREDKDIYIQNLKVGNRNLSYKCKTIIHLACKGI